MLGERLQETQYTLPHSVRRDEQHKAILEVKRAADVKLLIMMLCFMQRVSNDVVMKHSLMTTAILALKFNMKVGWCDHSALLAVT
ncbi:hypothetical protein M514_06812 [Trichuris suis]|uniref:Uncharacterized protein n=1 Tax=Trichuris suis TaxID=68888 RepID=A0A085NB64_9BILA|nr:hypothetical protein M513_06812 [Trichuris suis]KFD66710.1 hypothetical protein M514_06812 [Trichuris suis]